VNCPTLIMRQATAGNKFAALASQEKVNPNLFLIHPAIFNLEDEAPRLVRSREMAIDIIDAAMKRMMEVDTKKLLYAANVELLLGILWALDNRQGTADRCSMTNVEEYPNLNHACPAN
jgi:hypothetical protein